MPIAELSHFFVRARDLERSKAFYCDVLGFVVMPRPDMPFPGYWLGVNGHTQIHMGADGIANAGVEYFGTTPDSARTNSGVVDHIAFSATEPEKFAARLRQHGTPFRTRHRPHSRVFQIFVQDPDGLAIELSFAGVEQPPA